MAFSKAEYPPARRYEPSERCSGSLRRRSTRYKESNSGIWLPHMMNISPHPTLIGGQPTLGLVISFDTCDSGRGSKLWAHSSNTEEVAQVNTAHLDDTFCRRQGEVAVHVHYGI